MKGYDGEYPAEFDLHPGDILLVMTCQTAGGEILGVPARIPDDGRKYLHNQRLGRVQVDRPEEVDDGFLYSLFRWQEFNQHLFATSSGTKILHTAPSRIEDFSFCLPPIAEQRAIAGVLGVLDDKIEANRALNETLEATCQALFRSWFVDFDPVVAKSEGRRPPHLSDDGAALFPDRFEDSPIGPVPAGWRAGLVGEEYDLTMGQSPPGSTYNEDGLGLPFYQGRTDFRERYPVRRVYCTAPTRLAEEGDTLVSVRAPVGNTNQALEQCALGRGVGAVRHKRGKTSFTYYQMGALRDEFDVYNGYGTLFGSINKGDFSKLPIVVPPAQVVDGFEGVAGRLDAAFRANILEQQTLATLRDALLPRLLSGELRVRQAENLVEEAV